MRKFSLILSGPRERYQYEREDFLSALNVVVGGKMAQFIVSFLVLWLRIVTGTWKLKTRRRFHSAAQDNSRI